MIIEPPYLLLTGFWLDGNLIVLLLIERECKSVSASVFVVCEGSSHYKYILYQYHLQIEFYVANFEVDDLVD